MPPILVYEENKPYIVQQFHNGHFDYIDVVQEVAQRDFFRYVASTLLLERLAESYPWPRKKEEVPRWFYISADMAMRLHGNHAFHGFPWVVSTGGLLSAFGPEPGTKRIDDTGRLRIECKGFNDKNEYPRQTPCDPDFLRKIAKDTPAESLMRWFNDAVQPIFRRHRFFDKAGIFIGDGSYIFVPDNEHYEGSVKMFVDEHNHPVSKERQKTMSAAELKKGQWRRCYKMKREAARQRTLAAQRAVGERPPLKEPEQIMTTRIRHLTSWSSCSVPLDLVLCRDPKDDALDNVWGILSTADHEPQAVPALKRYHLRMHIEERHRRLKCFWDLDEFTSPCFDLVVNQIVFTALTYSLLQQQILRQARKALNKATKSRMIEELVPVSDHVVVYTDGYYAFFHNLEYTGMVLDVPEASRQKLRNLIRLKQSQMRLSLAAGSSP